MIMCRIDQFNSSGKCIWQLVFLGDQLKSMPHFFATKKIIVYCPMCCSFLTFVLMPCMCVLLSGTTYTRFFWWFVFFF